MHFSNLGMHTLPTRWNFEYFQLCITILEKNVSAFRPFEQATFCWMCEILLSSVLFLGSIFSSLNY
jgi:hypothetical protein